MSAMDDIHEHLRALLADLAVQRQRLETALNELIADHRRRSPFAYLMEPSSLQVWPLPPGASDSRRPE